MLRLLPVLQFQGPILICVAVRDANDRPILLVGMMGSGKSTVGPALAELLARDFVDLDDEIERRVGRTISQIFESDGEPAFRSLESEVVDALAKGDAVVALGGGAIAQPGASERLAKIGTVVYLRASTDSLMRRLGRAAQRPLLSGLDEAGQRRRLEEILQARQTAYETAQMVVETDGRNVEEIARRIAEDLGSIS